MCILLTSIMKKGKLVKYWPENIPQKVTILPIYQVVYTFPLSVN